jgi:integrase/recombinase XerD
MSKQTRTDGPLTVARPAAAPQRTDSVAVILGAWEAYLAEQVDEGALAATTVTAYRKGVEKFLDWCAERTVVRVTDDTVRDWKRALRDARYRPATINTWFAGLRALFTWAVGAGRLAHDPTAAVRAERRSSSAGHKRQALTSNEVRRLLVQPDLQKPAGVRDRALLAVMLYTGMRQIELHRANLSDLQTRGGRLVLNVHGKGRQEADEVVVLAGRTAQNALYDWLALRGDKPGPLFTSLSKRTSGGRLSLRSIRELVKGYLRAAGVRGEYKTTHSLRHTAITTAIARGAPLQKVQAMARHANINTTMIYFHEADRLANPAETFIVYDEEPPAEAGDEA